jgi:hypothetical protein
VFSQHRYLLSEEIMGTESMEGTDSRAGGGGGGGGAGPEQMDVESYASLYSGHTKIARLHFIADHCHSRALELEALRMAFDEIKKGDNTTLYREAVDKMKGRLGSQYTLDQEWMDSVDRRAAQRQEKLEMELNNYKVPFLLNCSFLDRHCFTFNSAKFSYIRNKDDDLEENILLFTWKSSSHSI